MAIRHPVLVSADIGLDLIVQNSIPASLFMHVGEASQMIKELVDKLTDDDNNNNF